MTHVLRRIGDVVVIFVSPDTIAATDDVTVLEALEVLTNAARPADVDMAALMASFDDLPAKISPPFDTRPYRRGKTNRSVVLPRNTAAPKTITRQPFRSRGSFRGQG